MPPEHARTFGGGAADTMINPFVLVAMVIAIVLILILPRRYAIIPFLAMVFFVPLNQQLVLGGFHLYVTRIMILFGLIRAAMGFHPGAKPPGESFRNVDWPFAVCALCQAVAIVLQFQTSVSAINQVAYLLDFVGGYFVLRFLIEDEEDILVALKGLAFCATVVAIFMLGERITGNNAFTMIGGMAPDLRDGRVRSQGPFNHALMAGAFGATLIPLFFILWKKGIAKTLAFTGMAGGLLIAWASNASTSVLTAASAILAICLWPIRAKMRKVRWGIVLGLIALQCVMNAPVWYVIARIDLTGSSSNYHRAVLIDAFVRHFSEWWLIGVRETGSWGYNLWDVQNQFVNVGETGGLLAFVLFIMVITRCFSKIGNARKAVEGDTQKEWFFWLLGCALFTNVVAFFGVNYFDNVKFAFFVLLAIIGAATSTLVVSPQGAESPAANILDRRAVLRPWVAGANARSSLPQRRSERSVERIPRRGKRVPVKDLPS